MWKLKRRAVVITASFLLVAGGAAAAAVAFQHSGSTNAGRLVFGEKLGHRPSFATPKSLGEAIQEVMARYRGQRVLSVRPGAPPNVPGARKGVWLSLTIAVPGDDYRIVRAKWEADIVQGAIAELVHANGLGEVVGSRVTWQLPDGTLLPDQSGGGMGFIEPGQAFEDASDSEVIDEVTSKLASVGIQADAVDVIRTDQPAPAVIIQPDDPRMAVANAGSTIRDVFGMPPRYEGYYLEIRDTSGRAVFIQAAAFRTGAGRHLIAPEYEEVDPIQHSTPRPRR